MFKARTIIACSAIGIMLAGCSGSTNPGAPTLESPVTPTSPVQAPLAPGNPGALPQLRVAGEHGNVIGAPVSRAIGHDRPTVQDLQEAAEAVLVVQGTGNYASVTIEQSDGGDPAILATAEFIVAKSEDSNYPVGSSVWVLDEPRLSADLPLLPGKGVYSLMFLQDYDYTENGKHRGSSEKVLMVAGILQGLWVDLDGSGETFTRADHETTTLPQQLTFAEAIAASPVK